MINGMISIVVIFLIFAVGIYFSCQKIWPENTTSVLSIIVVRIAAPALAVTSIAERFTRELLWEAFPHILVLFMYTLLLYITGRVLAAAMRLKNGKKTVFTISFTFSNTIFIGLPINQIVFGQEGLPFLFIFYIVTLSGFWSLGAYEIARASKIGASGYSVKQIFSPGLIGVLIGFALVQLNLSIPFAFSEALKYLGSLCVPLSLLVIGANLSIFVKGIPKITKDEVLILAGKFIISPLLMLSLLHIFHIEGMAFQVYMLTATMPCHMQTSILAEYHNVEGAYASKLVSLTTLASLITIPIYVALIL